MVRTQIFKVKLPLASWFICRLKHIMKFNEKNEIEPSISDFIEYIGSDKKVKLYIIVSEKYQSK